MKNNKCHSCGETSKLSYHHYMGKQKGRIIPLCRSCHDSIDNTPYVNGVMFGKGQANREVVAFLENIIASEISDERKIIEIKKWLKVFIK